jgi:hypothetical protein
MKTLPKMFLDWSLKHWTDFEKAGLDCLFLIETDQEDLKPILDCARMWTKLTHLLEIKIEVPLLLQYYSSTYIFALILK